MQTLEAEHVKQLEAQRTEEEQLTTARISQAVADAAVSRIIGIVYVWY